MARGFREMGGIGQVRNKGRYGISLMELIFSIFMLSLVIVSVAYVFSNAVSDIKRSKILTEGAFLAQTVMEVALIVEPFEPVPERRYVEMGYYPRFSYKVSERKWDQDASFFEIYVEVFHDSMSTVRPIAICASIRNRSAASPVASRNRNTITNNGTIEEILVSHFSQEEAIPCSR
jgi:hypothetical protein